MNRMQRRTGREWWRRWRGGWPSGSGCYLTSYRRRVLIINKLVASTVWHKLKCMECMFFQSALYLKGAAFRLQFIQCYLTGNDDVVWKPLMSTILRGVAGFGLDVSLFLMDCGFIRWCDLPPFYQDLFRAWTLFKWKRLEPAADIVLTLYKSCVRALNKKKLSWRKDTVWRERLKVQDDWKPLWRLFYKPPLNKRSGDLQWRILQGALAVNNFVSKINPTVSINCSFYKEPETIFDCFLDCRRLEALFETLKDVFLNCSESWSETATILQKKKKKKMQRSGSC